MTPAEKIHLLLTRGATAQVVGYVGHNPKLFNCLIKKYIDGPYRVTQHAARAVTEIAMKHPSLLKPHFKALLIALSDPSASTSFKRNTVRLFQFVAVPRWHHGRLLQMCFNFLQERKESIAVKVFAMSVLEILAGPSDELRRELQIVIEDQFPYSGPAFRSRAFKILKRLQALNSTTPVY